MQHGVAIITEGDTSEHQGRGGRSDLVEQLRGKHTGDREVRPRALTVSDLEDGPVRTGTASRLDWRSLQILDSQKVRLSEAVQRKGAGEREGPDGLREGPSTGKQLTVA
jgi:hypothetical protein